MLLAEDLGPNTPWNLSSLLLIGGRYGRPLIRPHPRGHLRQLAELIGGRYGRPLIRSMLLQLSAPGIPAGDADLEQRERSPTTAQIRLPRSYVGKIVRSFSSVERMSVHSHPPPPPANLTLLGANVHIGSRH